jgi:hypothetical protein
MKRYLIKKFNTKIYGYWLDDTHLYIHDSENDNNSSDSQTILMKIEKKLVAAILACFLNFTIFVPVSCANSGNNKLNNYIVSSNLNKISKKIHKKETRFSQKQERRLKQINEKRLRIILLKKYAALNAELKKLNPSLSLLKNNNGLKSSSLPKPLSQRQAEILGRIKSQRNFRSGANLDDSKVEDKSHCNISSVILKKSISKLVKKFEFIAEWIQNNPTLFSLWLIVNVSLLYLYKNGYFLEWYNLIKNSSPRFLDIAQNFNHLFEEENHTSNNFYERVHKMDPKYFTKENRRQTDFSFLNVKNDEEIIISPEVSSSTTLSVEEEPNLFSSTQELEREPTLEDYTDHWELWDKISRDEISKDKKE